MRIVPFFLALLWGGIAAAQNGEFGGLLPGPGQEEVFYTCDACHSVQLVTQQGLSREDWDDLMDWMIEEQGMPEPEPEDRALILDYLAEHYGRDRKR